MSEDTEAADGPDLRVIPDLSAAALYEWNYNVESIMRGVAHSLNNRAAALSAMIELSSDPGVEDSVTIPSILTSELERVRHLAAVVRTIGRPRSGVGAFA